MPGCRWSIQGLKKLKDEFQTDKIQIHGLDAKDWLLCGKTDNTINQ